MADQLTGNYHVRVLRPAFGDAGRILPRSRDRAILRRHALKLRYWPENHPEQPDGSIIDLDWSWIRSLPNLKVGELRIHETIGGNDNLRVIFHVAPPTEKGGRHCIWLLAVMQKRRDDFSANNINTFRGRHQLVRTRFYGDLE